MCSSNERNGAVEAEVGVGANKKTAPPMSQWIYSKRKNNGDNGVRIRSPPCPTFFNTRSMRSPKAAQRNTHFVTIDQHAATSTDQRSKQQPMMIIYGFDISHLRPSTQFRVFVGTIFGFNIVYAYLQELISIHIANRKFSLFISVIQFFGYAFWSYVLDLIRKWNLKCKAPCNDNNQDPGRRQISMTDHSFDASIMSPERSMDEEANPLLMETFSLKNHASDDLDLDLDLDLDAKNGVNFYTSSTTDEIKHESISFTKKEIPKQKPPLYIFIGLSLVRAVDVGMTNGAMRYINYPMKTLIKSSKVAFTMLGGMVIGKKKYRSSDYLMIAMLVSGLAVFINADMKSKTILFHPLGVAMLILSLTADGAFVNYAEYVMKKYDVSQDQFLFNIFSMSFIATFVFAYAMGELEDGFQSFFLLDGSIKEIDDGVSFRLHGDGHPPLVWSVGRKVIVFILFTLSGLCGSSSANAMSKHFGALTMSVATTSRKAFTLFISFAAFKSNKCTIHHFIGMVIFVSGLCIKSIGVGGTNSLSCGTKKDLKDLKEKLDDTGTNIDTTATDPGHLS